MGPGSDANLQAFGKLLKDYSVPRGCFHGLLGSDLTVLHVPRVEPDRHRSFENRDTTDSAAAFATRVRIVLLRCSNSCLFLSVNSTCVLLKALRLRYFHRLMMTRGLFVDDQIGK